MDPVRITLGVLFATVIAVSAWAQEQVLPQAPPATQATPPVNETHPLRIRIPADVQDKNVVHRVLANFPSVSERKITGTVVLHVIIAEDGTVRKLDAVSGPGNLRQSALDAVKQWKYTPTLLNGQPVEVDTTVNVVFSLDVPTADQPPPATPPAEETNPLRIRVPGDIAEKNLIRRVLPVYPPRAAFELHITGTVLLHVIISRDGSILKAGYISGPKELKNSAMDAMMEWKYRPTLLNGQRVEVDTTVKMVYLLN
jgi:TonB family protein